MNTNETIFFISAESKRWDAKTNEMLTTEMREYLLNLKIPFVEMIGFYKGSEEVSFMIIGWEHEHHVKYLKGYYEQDCYMMVDSNRFASLHYAHNNQYILGKFREITKEQADKSDSYTWDFLNNKFYKAGV